MASPDRKTHLEHLRIVLQRLRENGLVLNRSKCQFFRSTVDFLGLQVTAGGVSPVPEQLAAVKDFPQPNNIKELQGFLGAVNFYRRFIPSAAKILLPLTGELKGGRKGPELLTWSPPMLAAFNDIKEALMKAVCLAFPTETADLALATDASATHVGAVLQQREGGRWGSSRPSWKRHSCHTALSTENCAPSSQGSAISATIWKADGLQSGQITSH